jgi:hypothetical protein
MAAPSTVLEYGSFPGMFSTGAGVASPAPPPSPDVHPDRRIAAAIAAAENASVFFTSILLSGFAAGKGELRPSGTDCPSTSRIPTKDLLAFYKAPSAKASSGFVSKIL